MRSSIINNIFYFHLQDYLVENFQFMRYVVNKCILRPKSDSHLDMQPLLDSQIRLNV